MKYKAIQDIFIDTSSVFTLINCKGNLEYVKSVVFSFGSNISSGVLRCRLQNVSKETSCDFVILLNQYLKHEVYINII